MDEVKVTIIGAGSLTFTTSLVKGLMSSNLSEDSKLTVALMDVNPEILDLMYKVSREIARAVKGEKVKVERYTDRKSALEGTDFVIVTIGVGGVRATHVDVEIPLEYDIRQTIGDTVGPGGIMRALRHIPVLLDIAKDVEDLAPEAYLFNYSNPLTPLTRVMARETKAKAFGLCTGILEFRNGFADFLGVSRESVELYVGGINHLYWAMKLNIEGESLYPKMEEMIRQGVQIEKGEGAILLNFYKIYGLMPGPADRHIAEFFPKLFLTEKAMEKYGIPKFPEATIYDYKARKQFEELLSGVASGSKNVAELLGVKGMEEEGIGVVKLMESLALDKPMLYPGINVINKDCVGNLPSWSVVEVPAYTDSTGIHPVQVGDLPKAVAGFTTQRILQYEVTIDAALTGNRNLALQALLLDGYVDGVETAEKLLKDMLQAEKDWLPEYWFPNNTTKTY